MTPGEYLWQAWATNIGDSTITRKIADGTTFVDKGFTESGVGTVETRTDAKIMLDTIDAALLADATATVIEYEITTPAGSRRIKKSRAEVLEQRKYWAAKVARENAQRRVRETGTFGRSLGARFYES
jgi:hypothetical protein